jgi:hypothetical protein
LDKPKNTLQLRPRSDYESGGQEFDLSSGAPKAQQKSSHLHIIEIRHAECENLRGICMANAFSTRAPKRGKNF